MRSNLWLRGAAVCIAVLFMLSAAIAQENADDKAVDDYNFATWLYNGAKYKLAADAYKKFLAAHGAHAKVGDARFGLAQSLFHLNKFKEAAVEYENIRTKHQKFARMPEVFFQLAQTRVALNEYDKAAVIFADVRAKHAGHYLADWSMARQASCLINLKKFAEAEGLLKTFLGKYTKAGTAPDKVPAAVTMFATLKKAGVKAKPAFLSLVERSMFYHALALFNQEKYPGSEKAFAAFIAQYPKSKLLEEGRFRLAQSLYQQNSFVKAAAAYVPVASGKGEFAAPASFEKALALYNAKKLKEASAAFADMAKRFSKHPQATRARLYAGTSLFESGNFSGALGHLKPVAAAKKDLADEAAYWVGMSQLKLGKPADAETTLAAALNNFKTSTRAGDIQLGLADARLAQKKFGLAADAFRAYAQKFPKLEQAPRALYSACIALHGAGQYGESDGLCAEFLKSFASDKLVPQVLFVSGENRFLQKKYPESATRYNEFLQKPNTPKDRVGRAHFRLAWVHYFAKKYDAAVAEVAKVDVASAGKTVGAEASYLKGICLFETEKYAGAAQALDVYLKAADHSRYGDDALLKVAISQVKQEKNPEAAKSLEKFAAEYGKSALLAQAQCQLGETYYDLKQYAKAIANYAKVAGRAKADELSPYAQFGIGLCQYDQKKWAEAAAAFGQVAVKFKTSDLAPQALYQKGRSLQKLKKWAEAEQALRALLTGYAKHELGRASQIAVGACLQEQKKWAEAAVAFKAVVDNYPAGKDQVRMYYEQAWSLREAGKEAEALAVFGVLAQKFPQDQLSADANFYLGEAKYKWKPPKPADPKAKPVPENPAVRLKRYDDARALYEKALVADKKKRISDKAHYRIGWCYWLTRKHKEAAAEFDKLIQGYAQSNLFGDALFQAGQSYARAGQPGPAADRLKKLIGNPKFANFKYLPEAYLRLADSQIILSQPAEAVKSLAVIVAKYDKHRVAPQGYFLFGKAQFDLKQYDPAVTNFTIVTKRTKSELAAKAQFWIGEAYQAKSDWQNALMAHLRTAALYPQYDIWAAGSTFESGKCYEALKDKPEARKAYQAVVDQYPKTKWAPLATERLRLLKG